MSSLKIGHSALVLVAAAGPIALAAEPPQLLNPGPYANLVRLGDGSIKRVRASNGFLRSQISIDHGSTWSTEVAEFPLDGSTNPVPVLDASNRLHYFRFLVRDESNGGAKIPNVNYFRDIWHYTAADGVNWTAQMARSACTGSIIDAVQLSSGRLIVPYGDAFVGSSGAYGNGFTRAIYSDDLGQTWLDSPSHLLSPVPTGWNGNPDGACEPTIVQRTNGQVWMLMRTQAGALYESYSSDDGTSWSVAQPSNFYTSTGPPQFLRLDDGRLMLFWNNATMPPRYNGQVVYAGRDALHAAVSDDDGRTWHGFREIYLDPFRNENPISGDSGTAYPFATPTADGHALVITGQAQARTMLRIDPAWLKESSRHDDFSNGLSNWSVFKPVGPVVSAKRDRVVGPELVFDATEAKSVLHLRRPDSNDPDGAVWNFPMAKRGQTVVRLKLSPSFAGGSIALADRFFEPTDGQGEQSSIFMLSIAPDGSLPGGHVLETSRWYDLEIHWDLASHRAAIELDGNIVTELPQRLQAKPGPSYLRLRSSAATIDAAGFLVSSVEQTGLPTGPVRESRPLDFSAAERALTSEPGWTRLRFDDYVPNHNTTTNGNGSTGIFTGTFSGLVAPLTSASPVGILVTSSAGTVAFADATSAQVTSDIVGPSNGQTLTLNFVDPADPMSKAVVSAFAFRFGSTVSHNVLVDVFDVDGNAMPDYTVQFLDATVAGSLAGTIGLEDLATAPAIHSIVFTAAGDDTWLLGSFALDTTLADFAFVGFTVVPEPGWFTAITLMLGAWAGHRGASR